MASRLSEIVVDSADPSALAGFWAAALGYAVLDDDPDGIEIGPEGVTDEERLAALRTGIVHPTVVFVRVPEAKAGKNRLHLDLSPVDVARDEEVARLEALGATRTDLAPADRSWVVMRDPEGNEFCVLRSLAPEHFSL